MAPRFSAGYDAQRARVPKGRLKLNPTDGARPAHSDHELIYDMRLNSCHTS
jgi:hypothetical protein